MQTICRSLDWVPEPLASLLRLRHSVIVSATNIAIIYAHLTPYVSEKAENLRELHLAIKALNKLQAPQPQSEFAGYQVEEPGIEELLKYLGIFAKIWASVSLSPEVNKPWIDKITFALGSKLYCSVP
jgi:hypothetical protein